MQRLLRRWHERQVRLSKQAWDEDKQAARTFVEQQPDEVKARLAATIGELAALGETPEPSASRVQELLAQLDEFVEAGVCEDVYRLAVVDAAVEYLK